MKKSNMLLHAVVAAALSMGMSGAVYAADSESSVAGAADAAASEMEKCYGVVKAGQNGCAVADKHTCMGQGTMDGDSHDWIMLPKGTCEKLVNGSLEPVMPAAADAAAKEASVPASEPPKSE